MLSDKADGPPRMPRQTDHSSKWGSTVQKRLLGAKIARRAMPLPPGYHREELNKIVWEVPERYTDLSPIGVGAYGQVCSATDSGTEEQVAIKKLSRPFQSTIHSKRTYRELRMLKHMQHENIIGLVDTFTTARSLEEFEDVYLVTPLMGADLNSIVKVQKLSDDHVQFLIYQILRGLKYVHSAGIIHRDLKPSNIAVNEDCELKILDFGLARVTDDSMTGYVATRWYRAPEIMLNWMHYNQTVDIWSVGCIMAELLTSKVLFPGGDRIRGLQKDIEQFIDLTKSEALMSWKMPLFEDIDQLTKIMTLVGKPSQEFLAKIQSENARTYIMSMPEYPKRPFTEIFIGANPDAVDLLEKMLVLDPDNRITANDALQHPYISKYHDPEDEPTANAFDDSYESQELDASQWRELCYREITEFERPDQMET